MMERRGKLGPNNVPVGGGRRCVVVSPAGAAASSDLLASLGRRGLTTILVSDPMRAMIELAQYGAVALIVAEPDRVAQPQELVDAVRMYFPKTVCWQYVPRVGDRKGSLTPINGHVGQAACSPIEKKAVRVAESRDRLREVKLEEDHERLAELVVEGDPPPPEPLISEEELTMLLGPLPEEELPEG